MKAIDPSSAKKSGSFPTSHAPLPTPYTQQHSEHTEHAEYIQHAEHRNTKIRLFFSDSYKFFLRDIAQLIYLN